MPDVVRWDPLTEMSTMRSMLDRIFDQSVGRFPGFREGDDFGAGNLGLDVCETNDEYLICAAIPGVDPEDVDISIEDDVLTIKGEMESRQEGAGQRYHRRELRYGSFFRALRLPPTVDPERADASFENGMLRLHLPKRPESRARSIRITPQGVIEGKRSEQGGEAEGGTREDSTETPPAT